MGYTIVRVTNRVCYEFLAQVYPTHKDAANAAALMLSMDTDAEYEVASADELEMYIPF